MNLKIRPVRLSPCGRSCIPVESSSSPEFWGFALYEVLPTGMSLLQGKARTMRDIQTIKLKLEGVLSK